MAARNDIENTPVSKDEDFDTLCSQCLKGGATREGKVYCVECATYLCYQCLQDHNKYPVLRAHKTVDKSDVRSQNESGSTEADEPTERCKLHPGHVIVRFCKGHDELCCDACVTLKHRKCAKVDLIKDVAVGITNSKEFKEVEDTLKHAITEILDEQQKRKKSISSLAKERTKIMLEIDKSKDDLIRRINEIARQSKEDVDTKHAELLKAAELDINELGTVLSVSKEMSNNVHTGGLNDADRFTRVQHAMAVVKDVDRTIGELSNNWQPQNISYCLSEKITDTVLGWKSFGYFMEENIPYHVSKERNINVKKTDDTEPCVITGICTLEDAIQSNSGNQTGARGASGTSIPLQQSQKQTQNVGPIKETRKTSGRQTDADVASGSSVPTKQSQEQTQNVGRTKVHLLLNKYQGQQHVNATDAAGNQSVVQEASMTFSAFNQVQKQRQHIKVDKHAHDAAGNQSVVEEVPRTSSASNQVQKEKQLKQENTETRKTSGRQTDADVASGSSVPTKQSQEQTQNVGRTKVHLLLNKYQGQQHVNATDAAGNQSVVQEASMTFSAFNQVQKQRQHIKVDKHAHEAAGNQSVVQEVPRTSSASKQVQKEKQLKQENTETRKTSGRQTDADVASGSSVPTKQSQEQTQNVGRTKDEKPTVVVGARVRLNHDYLYGNITAVLPDGKVEIKWDVGVTLTLRVGTGYNDVTLV